MPKRKLEEMDGFVPFAPLQMKTHVGPKHLGDPKFMQEIYDRTLSLLRAGAAKQFPAGADDAASGLMQTPNPSRETSPPSRCLSPLPPDSSNDAPMTTSGENSPAKFTGDFTAQIQQGDLPDSTTDLTTDSNLLQLRIDSQGKLVRQPLPGQQTLYSADSRRCCLRFDSRPHVSCSSCKKFLCSHCSNSCDECHQVFCALCSQVDYRSSGESMRCFNCQNEEMT